MKHSVNFRPTSRHLILLTVLAVAIYVILPQFGEFRSSWTLVRHPSASAWVYAAVLLTLLTYPIAALTYHFLAFRPLAISRTTLVQLAAMFANRVLPAGVGALGVNYLYLRQERHRVSEAASVVAVNNLIGFAGHLLITVVGMVLFAGQIHFPHIEIASSSFKLIYIFGALFAVLCGLGILQVGRRRLRNAAMSLMKTLTAYRSRTSSLLAALLTSMGLTTCNVLAFAACLYSLDIHISFISLLLIFTVGVVTAIVTPTPGGLGGFEAGLAAGLVAHDVALASALAAALLYRLISYWLPLIAGVPAIFLCQRYGWLRAGSKS